MGWWGWLLVPLVVLSILESWLTHHFSEAIYRIGPVVCRRSVSAAGLGLDESHFKTLLALYWRSPSGEWLFQPRDLLYQSIPYKGRARLDGDAAVIEVRLALFPSLTLTAVLLSWLFQGELVPSSSEWPLVVPILAILLGISYLSARSAVDDLAKRLTSLTSASS